ncbi:hypothetical protein DY000_02001249 [Brassica cretica]|uniref:Uncharacterized protein n=1 Tax=Brassica cretica TaxID=69181 RepID=A0ABQ7C4J9_BRACR|nr:hypothetical protein DY000_02001249 [Brassica cretica]
MAAAVKRCDEEKIVNPSPPPSNDATRRKSRRISWRLWVTDNLAGLRNGQVCLFVFRWLQSLHPAFSRFHRAHVQGAEFYEISDKLEKGPLEQWNHTYHEVSRFLEQWNHTYHAYYLVSIVVDREIALEQRDVRRRPRKESATKAERSGSNDAVTYLRSRFTILCTNPQTKTSNFMILCKTYKLWLDDYKLEETKVRCSACSLVVMLCTTGYICDEV